MFKTLLSLSISSIFLIANQYSGQGKGIDYNKKIACNKALVIAKEEAITKAGTLVISSLESTEISTRKSFTENIQRDLQQISMGIVKLIDKKENIDFDKESGTVSCNIIANFEIDDKLMQKKLDELSKRISNKSNSDSQMDVYYGLVYKLENNILFIKLEDGKRIKVSKDDFNLEVKDRVKVYLIDRDVQKIKMI